MMLEVIGEAAMYEQLAEECTELAQAALKKARLLRGDNKPRMTEEEVDKKIAEELTDVCICIEELRLRTDNAVRDFKLKRFKENAEKEKAEWEEAFRDVFE